MANDPSVFRVHHEFMGMGQDALTHSEARLVENCQAVVNDNSLDGWLNTSGAHDALIEFKRLWEQYAGDIQTGMAAFKKTLGEVNDAAFTGDLMMAKAWNQGFSAGGTSM
jgi:hypothetical protein